MNNSIKGKVFYYKGHSVKVIKKDSKNDGYICQILSVPPRSLFEEGEKISIKSWLVLEGLKNK